jgi:hemerythrin superfamily protein
MTESASTDEITSLLASQHDHIKGLMTSVQNTRPDERESTFNEFRCYLAGHEAAEEHAMHAIATRRLDNPGVARSRVREEQEAAAAIADLEALDLASDEFTESFEALSADIIAHAEAEEHRELPDLLGVVSQDELAQIHRTLSRVNALADVNSRLERSSFAEMLAASEQALNGA